MPCLSSTYICWTKEYDRTGFSRVSHEAFGIIQGRVLRSAEMKTKIMEKGEISRMRISTLKWIWFSDFKSVKPCMQLQIIGSLQLIPFLAVISKLIIRHNAFRINFVFEYLWNFLLDFLGWSEWPERLSAHLCPFCTIQLWNLATISAQHTARTQLLLQRTMI